MSDRAISFFEKLNQNISKIIVGKEDCLRLLCTAFVAGGHVLLEDLPGTGKTKLAKALAKSFDLNFSRIQFTPDLLPTDITGLNVYDPKTGEFVLRKGPVFTNILLADEINRATPRTQAGLLEVMEEDQITIDGISYYPGDPFFVIATQNPVETAGTFPLPEAQMDRFMMRLSMGSLTIDEELSILDKYYESDPLTTLENVLNAEELFAIRSEAYRIYMGPCIKDYILRIVHETRKNHDVLMGVSPRGSLALMQATKAYACLRGGEYCIPDDVKAVAQAVLAHRILLSYGRTSDYQKFIQETLGRIEVPTEDFDK